MAQKHIKDLMKYVYNTDIEDNDDGTLSINVKLDKKFFEELGKKISTVKGNTSCVQVEGVGECVHYVDKCLNKDCILLELLPVDKHIKTYDTSLPEEWELTNYDGEVVNLEGDVKDIKSYLSVKVESDLQYFYEDEMYDENKYFDKHGLFSYSEEVEYDANKYETTFYNYIDSDDFNFVKVICNMNGIQDIKSIAYCVYVSHGLIDAAYESGCTAEIISCESYGYGYKGYRCLIKLYNVRKMRCTKKFNLL